jgi:diguanylate cyclase (GGDEF)-like protein/PAS domain S-box-containing protein
MKFFKASFAFKLTIFLLAISVIPQLLFQVVSYSATRQAILDDAKQHNMLLLANQRDYLNLQMEQINSLATNLASVDEINQVLAGDTGQSAYDLLATKARIGYVLSAYSHLGGLVSIDLFTLNGMQYHVGDTLNVAQVRTDLRDRFMQSSFSAGNRLLWHGVEDNVNSASSSGKVVVATRAIGRGNSSAGLLLINFSTDYLYRHFSNIDLGTGAYLMVVDAQKRLIFHPNRSLVGQSIKPELSHLLHGVSGSLSLALDGRDVLLSYSQMPDKDWYVVSVVPRDTLLAPMNRIERIGFALLALNLLIIALIIRAYLKLIVLPIRLISDGFKRFQANQLDAGWRMAKQNTLNEISELVLWFNSFLESMEANRQAQVALRIAATAFESQEGMLVTDENSVILRVNQAFTTITGYTAEEAVGQKMKLLKSGRHEASFYASMWEMISRTGTWQGEIWNRRKNGEIYPEWLTISAVRGSDGAISHYVGTMTDITARKAAEAEIKHLAFYDALTQLPNRRLLQDRLTYAMASSKRSGRYGALMFLDLDNFKPLNDNYGHGAGDALLIEAAHRTINCVRETDTVARFGGDEFVVLLGELDTEKAPSAALAGAIAEKIRHALAQPYLLSTHEVERVEHHCTASIGVVLFFNHDSSTEDVLKWADMAMYQAKDSGRNAISFYGQ